ncbi:hypothetical protein D3C87_2079340 [compost metagenome]
MSIFARPDYKSDTTQFIEQLRAQKPDLEARQLEGRALLWDKSVDSDLWQEYRSGRVEQQPYVYQTKA